MNYVEHSTLVGMPIPYRAVHGLLMTGTECLSRAMEIAKERSLDTAVIAEITASMALANAARALVIAIHQTRGLMKEQPCLGSLTTTATATATDDAEAAGV